MQNKTLQFLLIINLIATSIVAINQYINRDIEIDLSEKIIKVRGLVVTDSLGIERVIIAANLPNPQSSTGNRFNRGDGAEVSGIMLYDAEGQERGGYVTDNDYGNIFLTLDSKTSQRALFIAEPQGAATLQVWGNNGNKISIGAADEGIDFTMTENGKEKK